MGIGFSQPTTRNSIVSWKMDRNSCRIEASKRTEMLQDGKTTSRYFWGSRWSRTLRQLHCRPWSMKVWKLVPQLNVTDTKAIQVWGEVFVDASAYETGDLKWVHVAIGNFKAFLLGTCHGSCGDYQPYLNEFCFRYNRRFKPAQLFTRLSRAVATSRALLS